MYNLQNESIYEIQDDESFKMPDTSRDIKMNTIKNESSPVKRLNHYDSPSIQ